MTNQKLEIHTRKKWRNTMHIHYKPKIKEILTYLSQAKLEVFQDTPNCMTPKIFGDC